MIAQFVAVVILGYLLGSIPFGLLVGRWQAKVDIRQHGSGRTGATNVLRTAGRKSAALVAALDMSKGVLAVVFAGLIVGKGYLAVGDFGLGSLVAQVLAALAAIAGHIWPVFLKFRGGRGVIIGAGLTRFVSLGSIAGAVGAYAILVPLTIMNGFPIEYLFYALVGAIIILVMHRDNIRRLISGKERKLGEKAEKKGSPSSNPTEGAG